MAIRGVSYKGPDPKYVQVLESKIEEMEETINALAKKAGIKVKK